MKKYLGCLVAILAVIFARLVPFSWIIGSTGFYFSWSTMIAPIVVKYIGMSWIGLFFIAKKGLTASVLFLHILHRLPLVGAAYAYKMHHWFFSVAIPLICMGIFALHDVGCLAWPYTLYWLIPVALWCVSDSLFSRALTSSLVAHAIGSVIWLYCGDISAATWMGLIPVVFVERLLMAMVIVGLDLIVAHCILLYRRQNRQANIARIV